jgi:hypothetical protein
MNKSIKHIWTFFSVNLKQHVAPRQNRADFGPSPAGHSTPTMQGLERDAVRSCGAEHRGEEEERVPPAAGEHGQGDATLSHHTRRRSRAV